MGCGVGLPLEVGHNRTRRYCGHRSEDSTRPGQPQTHPGCDHPAPVRARLQRHRVRQTELKKVNYLLDGFKNINLEKFEEGTFPRKLFFVVNEKK